MAFVNPHSAYIDTRIAILRKSKKWNTQIVNTTHEQFIQDFSTNVFTNCIQHTFPASYLKKHPCSDCQAPSKERCHGIGEERPLLIKKTLEKVYSDISKPITLKEILIAFLEEHKTTRFALKCSACHRAETKKAKLQTSN
jgi:hypothetical protein